mmetsp:Transcript_92370/g.247112  ORF Transcript_92370/g.247112 Transcript_92370/m.247112 type:complete len:953 (-) Transcript_92370:94-2952(-)
MGAASSQDDPSEAGGPDVGADPAGDVKKGCFDRGGGGKGFGMGGLFMESVDVYPRGKTKVLNFEDLTEELDVANEVEIVANSFSMCFAQQFKNFENSPFGATRQFSLPSTIPHTRYKWTKTWHLRVQFESAKAEPWRNKSLINNDKDYLFVQRFADKDELTQSFAEQLEVAFHLKFHSVSWTIMWEFLEGTVQEVDIRATSSQNDTTNAKDEQDELIKRLTHFRGAAEKWVDREVVSHVSMGTILRGTAKPADDRKAEWLYLIDVQKRRVKDVVARMRSKGLPADLIEEVQALATDPQRLARVGNFLLDRELDSDPDRMYEFSWEKTPISVARSAVGAVPAVFEQMNAQLQGMVPFDKCWELSCWKTPVDIRTVVDLVGMARKEARLGHDGAASAYCQKAVQQWIKEAQQFFNEEMKTRLLPGSQKNGDRAQITELSLKDKQFLLTNYKSNIDGIRQAYREGQLAEGQYQRTMQRIIDRMIELCDKVLVPSLTPKTDELHKAWTYRIKGDYLRYKLKFGATPPDEIEHLIEVATECYDNATKAAETSQFRERFIYSVEHLTVVINHAMFLAEIKHQHAEAAKVLTTTEATLKKQMSHESKDMNDMDVMRKLLISLLRQNMTVLASVLLVVELRVMFVCDIPALKQYLQQVEERKATTTKKEDDGPKTARQEPKTARRPKQNKGCMICVESLWSGPPEKTEKKAKSARKAKKAEIVDTGKSREDVENQMRVMDKVEIALGGASEIGTDARESRDAVWRDGIPMIVTKILEQNLDLPDDTTSQMCATCEIRKVTDEGVLHRLASDKMVITGRSKEKMLRVMGDIWCTEFPPVNVTSVDEATVYLAFRVQPTAEAPAHSIADELLKALLKRSDYNEMLEIIGMKVSGASSYCKHHHMFRGLHGPMLQPSSQFECITKSLLEPMTMEAVARDVPLEPIGNLSARAAPMEAIFRGPR